MTSSLANEPGFRTLADTYGEALQVARTRAPGWHKSELFKDRQVLIVYAPHDGYYTLVVKREHVSDGPAFDPETLDKISRFELDLAAWYDPDRQQFVPLTRHRYDSEFDDRKKEL